MKSALLKGTGFSQYITEKLPLLKGTGFSLYITALKSTGALQAAKKLVVLKGHDLSRAVNIPKSIGPLGPEGCFSELFNRLTRFSAASLAPEGRCSPNSPAIPASQRTTHSGFIAARLKSGRFKIRILSAGFLAAALILCARGASAQAATETIEVDFSNPAVAPSHWKLTLHPDGSGYFSSYGGGMPGGNSDLKAPPVNREIHLTREFTHRVFETAYSHKLFDEKCDSHLKVAFQGEKTLSYQGPKGSGSCSFNYSKDREIQDLSDSMIAVEQTIMEGARLQVLLKHDPLGLDEEMNFLVQEAKDGRVQQICAIKAILVELANDPDVLDEVRKRANLLLQDAKI